MTKPRVNPLEWHPVNGEDALCHDHWVAPALGGAFHTAPDEDSSAGAWVLQWTICHDDFCMSYGGAITRYGTPEAAKAAAQADYEACILSALDMRPDPAVQALVEAARKLENNLGVKGVDVGSLRVDLYRALAAFDKTD